MRVKICGLTRLEDVQAALNEGADALGFVVDSPPSPRNLTLSKAKKLMKPTRVFSTNVAVTTTHDPKRLIKMCAELRPDALQLHHYTRKLIQLIRKQEPSTKLILATPIHDKSSLKTAEISSHYSDAILTDSPSSSGLGGTGLVHDWHLSTAIRRLIFPHPLILAGGLTTKNVKAAIEQVKPFAVDVSSGVERSIGVKDPRKLREFIMNAKGVAA